MVTLLVMKVALMISNCFMAMSLLVGFLSGSWLASLRGA